MTRTLLPLALPLLVLLSAAPARAQVITAEDDFESPQHFMFEFKLGPYAPNVDDGLPGPDKAFGHIFGDGTDLMLKGEVDVEVWRPFGTLAVGGVLGYYSISASAFSDNSPDGQSPSTSEERTGSQTSLTLLPISLLAIYRFDWPAERFKFPLVPFVKLGLNYTVWWINIDDNPAKVDGEEARGGTLGWQFNLGAALQLDILEPSAAKTLDVEMGINHTYIFFAMVHVAPFSDDKLNVGDTSWHGGLAFEF